MKLFLALSLALVAVTTVQGWGALFNRVNPAIIPEEEKTGHYYNLYTESRHDVEEPKVMAQTLDDYFLKDRKNPSDPCYQKKCTSNEHCCEGSVCVDMDATGTCMPLYGRQAGELCTVNSDCETGFVCAETFAGFKQCEEPAVGLGKYGDECRDSSECNIHLGFCCRLQRRQKMQPKKLCTYFTDSDICIGPVASHKVRRTVQYSANEKRQSGHPDEEFWRYRKYFY